MFERTFFYLVLVTVMSVVSCGVPRVKPSPSTVAGTWVNEIPGQRTILILNANGNMKMNTTGSALGPMHVTVMLGLIRMNEKWSVDGESITFEGATPMACRIGYLTSKKLILESAVTLDGGRKKPIAFVRTTPE
jgi:hypothetical protein